MNPEQFEQESYRKLYVARNVEGEPNREELKVIKNIEKALSKNPNFIGIAPFGSVVGGYKAIPEYNETTRETEGSDLDIHVLYDGAYSDENNPIEDDVREACATETARSGISIHKTYEPVSIEKVSADLKRHFSEEKTSYSSCMGMLASLSRVVTGKKVDDYRGKIIKILADLSSEQQDEVAEDITEDLAQEDQLSLAKRIGRLPAISEEEHHNILNERRQMWLGRVLKIWKLGKNK